MSNPTDEEIAELRAWIQGAFMGPPIEIEEAFDRLVAERDALKAEVEAAYEQYAREQMEVLEQRNAAQREAAEANAEKRRSISDGQKAVDAARRERDTYRTERDELRRQLEAAREDVKRLDWYENAIAPDGWMQDVKHYVAGYVGDTLREAIDLARTGGSDGDS